MANSYDDSQFTLSEIEAEQVIKPIEKVLMSVELVKEIIIQQDEDSKSISSSVSKIVANLDEGATETDVIAGNLSHKKILSDVIYIQNIYREFLQELRNHRSFKRIHEAVIESAADHQSRSEYIALYHGRKWKQRQYDKTDRVDNLKSILQGVEKETRELLLEKQTKINALNESIQEAKDSNPQWINYEKKLAEVRIENLKFHLEKQTEDDKNEVGNLDRDLRKENEAHETVMYCLDRSCEELTSTLDQWKEKFDQDSTQMENEIKKRKVGVVICTTNIIYI